MAEKLTEETVKDMMKLDMQILNYLHVKPEDVMLANDINATTKEPKESPSSFHARRREAITRVVTRCNSEWQQRENKLKSVVDNFENNIKIPTAEEIQKTTDKVITDLINGKQPITLYVNQVFEMIKQAEKHIALLDLLPVPEKV